jgi:hypothetical protein
MSFSSTTNRSWPWHRWLLAVAVALAVQVAVVFWLGATAFPAPRAPAPTLSVHLSTSVPNELSALTDPTLFALPHHEGFSGHAWLEVPTVAHTAAEWSEPTRPLLVATQQLGLFLSDFVRTNSFGLSDLPNQLSPDPVWPDVEAAAAPVVRSTLQLDGELVRRALVTPLSLPIWTNRDTLTNTVVQLVVDARGRTISMVLARPGSGLAMADDCALEIAKAVRFSPLLLTGSDRPNVGDLTLNFGRMIFQWRTVPGTNSAAGP